MCLGMEDFDGSHLRRLLQPYQNLALLVPFSSKHLRQLNIVIILCLPVLCAVLPVCHPPVVISTSISFYLTTFAT